MSKTVVINRFNSGLDEDVRSHNTSTFKDSLGFDALTYPHKLIPYGESEAEALSSGAITDKLISDVNRDSNGYLTMFGRNSAGSPTVTDIILKDSGTNIASTLTSAATDSNASIFLANTSAFYKANYYYSLSGTGIVKKMVSGTWGVSTAGTIPISASWANEVGVKPMIHPADDILYMARQQFLAKIDGTTFTSLTSVVIPTVQYITSLADYDSDLAIATAPMYEGGKSRVYLWNRNTSSSTFRANIDWGEGSLMILENIGGTLIGVSISDANYVSSASYDVTKTKKLTVRVLSGSQSLVVKELVVPDTFSLKNFKARSSNRLYFGGDNGDAIYVIQKNADGSIIVSKDRYVNNGTAYTTLRGLALFGDYLFTMFDTAGQAGNIYRTKVTSSYTNTSVFETNINPSMDIADRAKLKGLNMVSLSTAPLIAGASVTVKYSVDGAAYTTLFTESTDGRITTPSSNENGGSPFLDGYEYQFKIESTGGAEPTELRYKYEVKDTQL